MLRAREGKKKKKKKKKKNLPELLRVLEFDHVHTAMTRHVDENVGARVREETLPAREIVLVTPREQPKWN